MIKKGCKVVSIGPLEGIEGVVTSVQYPRNCSMEEHGTIEIRITKVTKPKKYRWLSVGDLEHFVFHGWEKSLKIVK